MPNVCGIMLCSIGLGLTTPASGWVARPGSENPDAGVSAWVESMVNIASTREVLSGVRVEWRLEWLYVPPPAELAAMRERVRGRPMHPDRERLAAYEARGRGSVCQSRVLWLGGPAGTRLSSNRCGETKEYFDKVVRSDLAWGLHPQQLTLTTAGDAPIARALAVDRQEFDTLLSGGLSELRSSVCRAVRRAEVDASGRWAYEAECAVGDGTRSATVRAEGRWSVRSEERTIDRVRITIVSSGGTLSPMRIESSDWRWDEVLRVPIAGRVDVFEAEGLPERRLSLVSVVAVGPEEIKGLLEVPDFAGSDAYRGPSTFGAIVDETPGRNSYTKLGPGGVPETARIPEPVPSARERAMRVAGWMALAGLTVLFIYVRVRSAK